MKLRNKLIPLASCLAIGATVAPMVTACATSGFVDLKDGFIPTISRLELEDYKLGVKKAEQVYFNAVSQNPDVFVQDYNWTMSTALRTAAENPNNVLGDTGSAQTSILNYARQSITNVKIGKTNVVHPAIVEGVTKEVTEEFFTLSFDLVREQQYTWKHEKEVVSGQPTVQATTVGTTLMTMHFSNIPMNFNRLLSYVQTNSGQPTNDDQTNYNGHLGRGLFNASNIETGTIWLIDYIPGDWFLTSAVTADTLPTGAKKMALYYMTDPWELSYSYETSDTESYVYNDVTRADTTTTTYGGTYNDTAKISETDTAARELMFTTIGSHYLSDIQYDPSNK